VLLRRLDRPDRFTVHFVFLHIRRLVVRRRTHAISYRLLQKARTLLCQLETTRRLLRQLLVVSAWLGQLLVSLGLFCESGDPVELVYALFLLGKEVAGRVVLIGRGHVLEVLDELAHDVAGARAVHDLESRVLRRDERVELYELVALDAPVVRVTVRRLDHVLN